jgi:elongator complex protein 1
MVVPKSDRTILQMPRGNLETIQHRALSIAMIKPLLDKHNYKEALHIMHKQQMDYNLFYDHHPQSFITNAEKFVNDLDARSLTTFLSELNDEDVTRTIYKNSYNNRTWSEAVNSQKIDMICQVLRTIMERNSNEMIEVSKIHSRDRLQSIKIRVACSASNWFFIISSFIKITKNVRETKDLVQISIDIVKS